VNAVYKAAPQHTTPQYTQHSTSSSHNDTNDLKRYKL